MNWVLVKNAKCDHGLERLATVVDEALGLDRDTRGAFISGVVEGGPAEKAGLRGSSGETEIEG